LRTGPLSEDALRSFVGRLTVTIEARAVGSVTTQSADGKGAQLTQANELLHSTSVDEDEPTVCAVELHSEEDEDGPKRYLYSFWKTLIPIGMLMYNASSGSHQELILNLQDARR